MQSTLLSEPNDAVWTQIAPLLDDAMSGLGETDRAALVLRFFENKTTREIADALKLNEATAQKRVTRALEKLRELLAQRGIKTTTAALSVVITAHAVQAVPVGMAATITAAATIAGTTLVTTTIATATKTIAMTTLQKTIITATVAALAGVGIYEARQATNARAEVQTLQQQVEQNQQLQKERDDATNRLALMAEEIMRLKSNPNQSELLKLRGEVTRLRAVVNESWNDTNQSAVKSLLERVDKLKHRFAQHPEANIPEMILLQNEDWIVAVKNIQLDSEVEYRQAMSDLRTVSLNKFLPLLSAALGKFLESNAEKFPTEMAQLSQYFDPPVDDTILKRYTVEPAIKNNNTGLGGDWVIVGNAPLDVDYDSHIVMGTRGSAMPGPDLLRLPHKAFEDAHNGQSTTNILELLPYATTPNQKNAIKNFYRFLKE